MYLTGDLGRHDVADGSIHFLGRKDRQAKLNGQRVELGEIESAVKAVSPGREAVVDYFSTGASSTNKKLLVTYFFGKRESGRSSSSRVQVDIVSQAQPGSQEFQRLVTGLKEILPAYMVPRVFVTASCLPLSDADKVGLQSLRAAYGSWAEREVSSLENETTATTGEEEPLFPLARWC